MEAARYGHERVVRRLLQIEEYSQLEVRAAMIAAVSICNKAVLDMLVTYAAKIENFDWPSRVLCRTSQHGHIDLVKKLLESGASPNVVDEQGLTPLHLAARHRKSRVAQVLLEHKASSQAQSPSGWTPLHTAAKSGCLFTIQHLCDHSANLEAVITDGWTALDIACDEGHYKVVQTLSQAQYESYDKGILVASAFGFAVCARLLLEKGANAEVRRDDVWSPLALAGFWNHIELCRLLLDNGANPNRLQKGEPILSLCVRRGNLEVVRLLVERGAIVSYAQSELSNGTEAALHKAARNGFAHIMQLLIDSGADVNRPTEAGYSPLYLSYNHPETTQMLLKHGADINYANPGGLVGGFTSLHYAVRENCVEVVEALLSCNANLEILDPDYNDTVLMVATRLGHIKIMSLLLEAGADVNQKGGFGDFPLLLAVEGNQENVLRTLIGYDLHMNLQSDNGNTALHVMDSSTPVVMIKTLVNRGADPNIRNNNKLTPLCMAVKAYNVEVVEYLAKLAEINITGSNEGGLLNIASYESNLEIIKILKEAGTDVNRVDPIAGSPLMSASCSIRWRKEKNVGESIIQYLLDEANADVSKSGGLYGCSINAACAWSSAKAVNLILEKGAEADIKDGMGRSAIHFAAMRDISIFQAVLEAGGDVEMRDTMGRTALHWTAAHSSVGVINRVISLSRGFVDPTDVDGWTPLLWALKNNGNYAELRTPKEQEEVVKLLLERGADPCVIGKGLEWDWSPVRVAKYHRADHRVIQALEEAVKQKVTSENAHDTLMNGSGKIATWNVYCDCCLQTITGTLYNCESCGNFDLCSKCYRSKDVLHPGHFFKIVDPQNHPSATFEDASNEDDKENEEGYEEGEEEEEEGEEEEEEEEEEEGEDEGKDNNHDGAVDK